MRIDSGITCELCRTLTDDGLELQGFYVEQSQRSDGKRQRSEATRPGPGRQPLVPGASCLIHVHGWDGNFYENRFIDHAAAACGRMGIGFVSGNNRGHDYVADILRNRIEQRAETSEQNSELRRRKGEKFDYVQVGGVYEELTDCVPDIRAWIDFAVGRGAKRVILQGHSHGAIKVTHYLTTTRDPRVCGLILLSPSDDMGIARRDLGDKLFMRLVDNAHALTHAGMGRQILPVKELKYPVSAATFYDCHNKNSLTGMFNMSRTDRSEFPELAAIRLPVLMAVGTVEEAFVGAPGKYIEDVKGCMINCPSFAGAVIEGAPHNYLGQEAQLAKVLEEWLRSRIPGVRESRMRGRV